MGKHNLVYPFRGAFIQSYKRNEAQIHAATRMNSEHSAKWKKPTHGQELSITGQQRNQKISSCQGVWLGEMRTTASCWLNKGLPLGDGEDIQRRVTVMSAHREWSKRCWATVHFKTLKQEMWLCAFYCSLKINCEAGGLQDQGQKRSTLQTL